MIDSYWFLTGCGFLLFYEFETLQTMTSFVFEEHKTVGAYFQWQLYEFKTQENVFFGGDWLHCFVYGILAC